MALGTAPASSACRVVPNCRRQCASNECDPVGLQIVLWSCRRWLARIAGDLGVSAPNASFQPGVRRSSSRGARSAGKSGRSAMGSNAGKILPIA